MNDYGLSEEQRRALQGALGVKTDSLIGPKTLSAMQSQGYSDPVQAYQSLVPQPSAPFNYLDELSKVRAAQNAYMQDAFNQQSNYIGQSTQAQQKAVQDNIKAIQKAYDTQKQGIYDTQEQQNTQAYGAYQKAINPYGVTAESLASVGQLGSGMSDFLQSQAYSDLRRNVSGYNNWANSEIQELEQLKAQAEAEGNLTLAQLYAEERDKRLAVMQNQMQYQMSAYEDMLKDAQVKMQMQQATSGRSGSGGGSGGLDDDFTYDQPAGNLKTSPNVNVPRPTLPGIANTYNANLSGTGGLFNINGKWVPSNVVYDGLLTGAYHMDDKGNINPKGKVPKQATAKVR